MHAAAHDAPKVESDHPFGQVDNKKLAMWLFLGSDAMGFTGLLAAYSVLRITAGAGWVPQSYDPNPEFLGKPVVLPQELTLLNTTLLIASSVTMVLALKALRSEQMGKFKALLAATALGGIGFLTIQFFEWRHMVHILDPGSIPEGATESVQTLAGAWGTSNFASSFFVLTGYHGFHVFIGVVLLLWGLVRAHKGVYSSKNYMGIEVIGLYWHFVDLVWILLFTLIYLLQGS
jgi:cytochrome c oxidase subunit 3